MPQLVERLRNEPLRDGREGMDWFVRVSGSGQAAILGGLNDWRRDQRMAKYLIKSRRQVLRGKSRCFRAMA